MTQLQGIFGRIGRKSLGVGFTVLAVATGSAAADPGTGSFDGGMTGGSWGMHSGWGMSSGWGMFGGWGLLWFVLLIVLAAFLFSSLGNNGRSARSQSREGTNQMGRADRALVELRERYARGEIDDEEFERRHRTLRPDRGDL